MTRYLTVRDVAARYQLSPWTLYERTRLGLIPHRKHPGSNRLLFTEAELDAWDEHAGALETITLPPPVKGLSPGRLVRVRQTKRAA